MILFSFLYKYQYAEQWIIDYIGHYKHNLEFIYINRCMAFKWSIMYTRYIVHCDFTSVLWKITPSSINVCVLNRFIVWFIYFDFTTYFPKCMLQHSNTTSCPPTAMCSRFCLLQKIDLSIVCLWIRGYQVVEYFLQLQNAYVEMFNIEIDKALKVTTHNSYLCFWNFEIYLDLKAYICKKVVFLFLF